MNLTGKNRRSLLAAALGAALPLSVLLGACGGGGAKKVDAEDWVADVCDRFVEYDDDSNQAAERLFEIDFGDPEDAKDELIDVLEEQEKLRADLHKDFKGFGEPDIEGGSDVVKLFDSQFKKNDEEFESVLKKIKDLDADEDFEDGVVETFDDVEDPDFRGDLEDLADDKDDVNDIIDLIDEDPECASVIFNEDDQTADPEPSATPKKTTTPVAKSTPKPNANKNEKWVTGLCVAMDSYVMDLEDMADSIQPPSNATGQAIKAMMVDFMTDARDRTQQLKQDVNALGAPDVKDGSKIQTAMVNATGQLVAVFDQAVKDANALNPNDLTKLASDIDKLGTTMTDATSDIEAAFEKIDRDYDTTALTKIADNVPECGNYF